MYRIYDVEAEQWITNECVLAADGTIYKLKNSELGDIIEHIQNSLPFMIDKKSKYILHRCTYIPDKSNNLIFEGDIIRNTNGDIGMVYYSTDLAAYVFLIIKENTYYPLSVEFGKKSKIIGNAIDDEQLLFV